MPTAEKHLALSSEYISAVSVTAEPRFCRPMAVTAYYAAVHIYEALFDLKAVSIRHSHSHQQRITTVLSNPQVFGQKEVDAFFSLYNFSYMSRYILQIVRVGTAASPPISVDIQVHFKQSVSNIKNIVDRLNLIIARGVAMLPQLGYKGPIPISQIVYPSPTPPAAGASVAAAPTP